ncbi:MAG: hypothetical protein F4195_10590 [Gammaproteobacteria bacterium]|nr:hypothetical protein [Gammaproteobacteria bacterium]
MIELQPFQRNFIAEAYRPGIDIGAISAPRGSGKTTFTGWLAAEAFRKIEKHQEVLLVAGSVDQGRAAFRAARQFLGEDDYRYTDSAQRCYATRADGAKLILRGASGRGLQGIVNCPLCVADEPGAWKPVDGELMADALFGALGKPESPLRLLMVGTLAPGGIPGHWWHDLCLGGNQEDTHVTLYQGDPKRWDDLRHIYSVNPLARISPDLRRKLRIERDKARRDPRLKGYFLSYRLNVPTGDESTMLLTVPDWQLALEREFPPRDGRPIVGADLGGGRAWSAAAALWPSGRCEALAIAPGIPTIREQEKRDIVPAKTYSRLVDSGRLRVAEGLRVPPPSLLVDAIRKEWGRPRAVICDRFRIDELADAAGNWLLVPRVTRWSDASADIRALRKLVKDGPLSVPEDSRALLTASLAAAMVKNDDQGSTRLVKRGSKNQARDDVSAALVLAAGAWDRAPKPPRLRFALAG